MRAILLTVLAFGLAAHAFAQSGEDEMRRLSSLLDAIHQEQQSLYQQFQMTESLQRNESRGAGAYGQPGMVVEDGRPPSYDDAQRARQARRDRLDYYAAEMQRLSDRYNELGSQSAAILEQMRALGTGRPSR